MLFDRAHSVRVLSLDDEVGLFGGSLPPDQADDGSFPLGSLYLRTNGTVWRKTGQPNVYAQLTGDTGGGTPGTDPNGEPIPRYVHQYFRAQIAAMSGSSKITFDNDLPSNTEGTEIWSQTVTPGQTLNEFEVGVSVQVDTTTDKGMGIGFILYRDGVAVGAVVDKVDKKDKADSGHKQMSFLLIDAPMTVNPVTYSLRVGKTSTEGNWMVGRTRRDAATWDGLLNKSSFVTLKERNQ